MSVDGGRSMSRQVFEIVQRAISRRAFIARITAVVGAFIGGLLGSKSAFACYYCCGLCKNPQHCTWNPNACACVWCWVCSDYEICMKVRCKECLITPFTLPCEAANCECHATDVHDSCRYCNPDTVICSRLEMMYPIGGCS